MGFSPFQLKMGQIPQVLPPLISINKPSNDGENSALEVIRKIHINTLEAQDNCKGNWKLDLAELAGGPKSNILVNN